MVFMVFFSLEDLAAHVDGDFAGQVSPGDWVVTSAMLRTWFVGSTPSSFTLS